MKTTKIEIKIEDIENYTEVIEEAIEKTNDKRKRSYKRDLNKKLKKNYRDKDTLTFEIYEDRRTKLYGKTIHKLGDWDSTKMIGEKVKFIYIPTAFIELEKTNEHYRAKLSIYDMTKTMESNENDEHGK